MKLLILSSRFPYPLDKGDKLRLYYQIKELSKFFEIHLVSIIEKELPEEHKSELEPYCHQIHTYKISKRRSYLNTLISTITAQNHAAQSRYFFSSKVAHAIKKLIEEIKPDHIYCQLLRMVNYLDDVTINTTVDLMDAFSTGAQLRADSTVFIKKWFWQREAKLLSKLEQNTIERFYQATIISDLDKRRIDDSDRLTVINNGIDSHFFEPVDINPKFDAVFVGNMGYFPNIEAVRYISKEIIPAYKNNYNQSIKVNIVGPNNSNLIKFESENMNLGGWYDNVTDGYASGKIFLAPLFKGIGQQNKILEAMAIGLPCISTPDVANALKLENKVHLLIAENSLEFCQQINKLLNDQSLYNELVANAKSFVLEKYKWDAVCRPLVELINNA